ncbi:MAG: leuB [Alphaproteobacteria bacterium]|nr:leuB [Alphaproteobacteria bacterium]
MKTANLLVLPGDGIGQEIAASAISVIAWFNDHRHDSISVSEDAIGGAAYDLHGTPLAEATLAKALASDCVLLGAVGGPQYARLDYASRPEAGLLGIRAGMGLFANLRPVFCFDELVEASTLRPEVVRGIDLVFVRELSSGVYFGEPRGIETLPDGSRRGVNTHAYTTAEIKRVSRVAFELARQRNSRIVSLEKSNVMEAGLLWREEVQALRDADYTDVELSHMLADNAAMQLVKNPRQFDVILTDNLFGDILSDEAAMLTGSLGMLPSASLGAEKDGGGRAALYEPIHGSAPDIAGKDLANPLAMLLSLAMALRLSLGREQDAASLEGAIRSVLAAGHRTGDLPAAHGRQVGTRGMTELVIAALDSAG